MNLINKDGQNASQVTMLLEYIVTTIKTGFTISTTSSAAKCGQVRRCSCTLKDASQ